jgi:hypothetical protein
MLNREGEGLTEIFGTPWAAPAAHALNTQHCIAGTGAHELILAGRRRILSTLNGNLRSAVIRFAERRRAAMETGRGGSIQRSLYLIDRFRVVFEWGGGWNCACADFVASNACRHTREAAGRRAAQAQIAERLAGARSSLPDSGTPPGRPVLRFRAAAIASPLPPRTPPTSDDLADLDEQFDQCDINGDLRIDFTEFSQLLENLGSEVPPMRRRAQFNALDLDRDGTVDRREFMDWWRGA